MIINPQIRKYLRKARILFVIQNCSQCAKWKEFIERENLTVPFNKRVRVIDCTSSNSLNIVEYGISNLFDQYMDKSVGGNFPFLFFDGNLFCGINSKIEAEAFIKAAFNKDLIVKVNNKYIFDKNCRYIKRGFRKKTLVCN